MAQVLNQIQGKDWALYHGDNVEVLKGIPDNSIHYTVTSPPFANLYTYSASDRDMGNCKDDVEFFEHFRYLISELHRVTMPGRLISLHCMNLPSTIQNQGYVGIRDFRGDLIRAFVNDEASEFYSVIDRLKFRLWMAEQEKDSIRINKLSAGIENMESELQTHPGDHGFYFHSEVCIWKDPVVAMQRTKSIRLLHKQLCKDSAMSGQGLPDYVITFRKPGKNTIPISGELFDYVGDKPPSKSGDRVRDSINIWQKYADPVWHDINPSDTLQFRNARDNDDERHICPLQTSVIKRCLQLWSLPGEVVLEPFAGIGSVPYCAVELGRKAVGCELKKSYFDCAVNNLKSIEQSISQPNLLDMMGFAI
jgi:DNA modification methylase